MWILTITFWLFGQQGYYEQTYDSKRVCDYSATKITDSIRKDGGEVTFAACTLGVPK